MATHEILKAGLNTCCLETLGELHGDEFEDEIIPCKKCTNLMHLHNGNWALKPPKKEISRYNLIRRGRWGSIEARDPYSWNGRPRDFQG